MRTLYEGARGCGYRKEGGIYLVSGGTGIHCPLMPVEMTVCTCCGQGIKPARGFTWVSPDDLLPHHTGPEAHPSFPEEFRSPQHPGCPLNAKGLLGEKCGLLWIGEKFYPTPADWLREGANMGFSRRIHQVPRDFVIGETWVLAGHRKAIRRGYIDNDGNVYETMLEAQKAPSVHDRFLPGVFHIWLPERIEYVVKGTETAEELAALEKRGIEPVKVIPLTHSYMEPVPEEVV